MGSPYNENIEIIHKDKLEGVRGERYHNFFCNLRVKKTSVNGYQIFREFTKTHCSTCKHVKSNAKCAGKWCDTCFTKKDDV